MKDKSKRNNNFNKQRKTFCVLIILVNLFLLASYVYLVDASVLHASRVKNLDGQIMVINSELADLEGRRLKYVTLIDFDFASSINLVRTDLNGYAVVRNSADTLSRLGL